MNGNADRLVLDIMFMVPEIDACLTLAFRNRSNVTSYLEAVCLFLSQRQSALNVENRPIPSVSRIEKAIAVNREAIASCVLSCICVNPVLFVCSYDPRTPPPSSNAQTVQADRQQQQQNTASASRVSARVDAQQQVYCRVYV